jgi:phosphoribosyl 1,2-cyclic phosphodiesterase
MFTCSLQSGSNGNCIYVETADARLLFDAGISGKSARERLAEHGRDIHEVDAVLISHNHRDHVAGAGVFQRKFSLPFYITAGAWRAVRGQLGPVNDVRHFKPGEKLRFGTTTVTTVPTAHDGVEGVAFVISQKGKNLGIFTDLGHCFEGLEQWIAKLDGLYLESNYDPKMLAEGSYPAWLKRRISGPGGHISNHEACGLVRNYARRLEFLVLAHLSQDNNHPELALETAKNFLGGHLPIALAPRTGTSAAFVLE